MADLTQKIPVNIEEDEAVVHGLRHERARQRYGAVATPIPAGARITATSMFVTGGKETRSISFKNKTPDLMFSC